MLCKQIKTRKSTLICAAPPRTRRQEYHKLIPKEPGWEERHQLYLLYHYLNHYVLFGSSYRYECVSIMESLIAKL